MNSAGIFLVVIGLLSFAGGLFNWKWFMNVSKVRSLAKVIGQTGARIFHILLGLSVIVYGILITLNIVGGNQ